MASEHSMEIRCTACGQDALARPEPVYEGFRKVGEVFVCTACGHRFASRQETPFIARDSRPRVFTDADRPAAVKLFRDDERRRCCGWCAHFVVNPFGQRCGLTNQPTEATGLCDRFEAPPEESPTAAPDPKPAEDPLAKLFRK